MDEYYPPEEDREHPASISGVHLMEHPSRRTSGAPQGMDPRLGDRSLQPIEDLPTIPGVPVLSNDVYPPTDPGASGSRFGPFGEQGQRLFGAGWEQAQHSARGLLRILEKRPGGVRKRVWLAGLLIVVLLVALLPPIVTVVRAAQDYQTLKALGESGIHHLLAAKDDLSGIDTSELDGFSSLLNANPAVAPNAPYSYLLGRQAGTFYDAKVTVHSSSQLKAAGIGDATYTTNVGTDTTFTMTPPAKATPTPSPTPSPTATPNGAKKSLIPDAKTLAAALDELKAAQRDFGDLRSRLNNPDWILSLAGIFPGATAQLVTVRILADVGYEACGLGIEFMNAISPILGRLGSGLLASDKGIVTKPDLDNLQNAVKHAQQELTDIQNRLAGVNINDLPITADQKQTFTSVLDQLPKMQNSLKQAPQYLTMLGWMLGVGQSRHFLVQTLDRNELRPTGGFTGDYGVLTITDGRLDPFELKNINQLDYNGNGWIFSHRAPAPYTWWPFGNWGLRDSNLSPDYPTTAKMNMQVFHNEGGDSGIVDVDGVIQITPVAISHVLNVTGPIFVPGYNETITADNLEARIKYYQQDPAGIAKQKALNPDDPHIFDIRKRFTQLVVRLIQDQVKKLPTSKLIPLAKQELADMRARDVQIYVTNKDIEDLLVKARASGAMDVTPGVDGYTLNQANVSVAKTTQYVKVTQTDDVTLDNSGGATHRLTITLNNRPTGPTYGFTTYKDYVRIYVPPQARLQRADGFDSGQPYCWTPPPNAPTMTKPAQFATVPDCPPVPYSSNELVCPAGGYSPGAMATTGGIPWVLDSVGPPTNTTSDLPNRAMYGGYVIIPQFCTATISLRYYVPNIVHPEALTKTGASAAAITSADNRVAGYEAPQG
jgi:uncharacterized protein DUF4012